MAAVMVLLSKKTDWATIKMELGDSGFLNKMKNLDKDNISNKTLQKLASYTKDEEFTPVSMTCKSMVAGELCVWVRAVEDYAKCLKLANEASTISVI